MTRAFDDRPDVINHRWPVICAPPLRATPARSQFDLPRATAAVGEQHTAGESADRCLEPDPPVSRAAAEHDRELLIPRS